MRVLALLSLFGLAAPAGEPGPTALPTAPQGDVAVRCGKLYVGDGQILEDAWLLIRDGKVVRVQTEGDRPLDLPILDASDKVVLPGLVAADSPFSGHRDADYNVTPDFVALDGFDYLREYRTALSGGVTTTYLAPGRNRLISGQGSVVKLAGRGVFERTLAETACLRLTLGKESTTAPVLFEPNIHPTSDDPLLPARKQFPSARISQLATLRRLFEAARESGDDLTGMGSAENQYDASALRRAAAGELPLRIAARAGADVRRAVAFGRELDQTVVLENPFDIAGAADYAARAQASAVFRIPVRISESNPGGENRDRNALREDPASAGIAAQAGMRVALAPARAEEFADFLMMAGIAIRYGMDEATALRAVTLDAARILGVADRVGSLEAGKDADFVVLSGEPFAIGTMVEETFVSGTKVWERSEESSLLALRCERILTGTGETLTDGVLLVQDGKIKAVGSDLAIPYGARIVDLPEAVVTPGFINAQTSLGLSGFGGGIPNGSAEQRLHEVIPIGDPLYQDALAAGLTTLLVSGKDPVGGGTRVAGRVTAVKPAAADRKDLILRETAAIRILHDDVDPKGLDAIKNSLQSGKQYIEAWKKYEKALADFEAGKGAKPEAAEVAEAAPEVDPITGTWEISVDAPVDISITANVKLSGTTVTGQIILSFQGNELPPATIENGSFEGGTLRLSFSLMGNSSTLEATVQGDSMSGDFPGPGGQSFPFSGRRTSSGGGGGAASSGGSKSAKADDGAPKKPAVNEALEPIRALLEKRIPAVVRSDRGPAMRGVIELMRKEELPFLIQGGKDALEAEDLLGDDPPAMLLGPNLVRREKGEVVNAASHLADRGVSLAFASGDTAGARYLPLHAAHAVRYGLDPQTALRALTIDAARMFQIDDRVGSLEKGKDADFVVFSGNPFEVTSQVLMVVSGGEVVVDRRGGVR